MNERRPAVGSGRIRPGVVAIAALVTVVLVQGVAGAFGVDVNTVTALTQTFAAGTIALSLVVVSGYTGQLSLAQYALAGVGAYVAARTASGGELVGLVSFGTLPLEVAILFAVAITIPVGVLVGLPAARTRGVNLAIATLGLALLIERVVLGNADYTGGVAGTQVEPQTFLGISIDSVTQPRRYALFCLGIFALCALATANLRRGRSGRQLIAVRTNERAAAALGISVAASKLYAFAVASGIAALGGVSLAFASRSVVFSEYTTTNSIQLVVQTVLGGIGFVGGAIFSGVTALRGLVVHLVDDWFSVGELTILLIAGVAMLINLIKFPDGVVAVQARAMAGLLDGLRSRLRRHDPRPAELPPADRTTVPARTLEVRGITVSFGGVHALTDVDTTVGPGEVVGLIGPNGAGKTTFIDTVTGFTRPSSGDVRLDGDSLLSTSVAGRARLGVTRSFQSLELFEDVTVLDNLRAAADTRSRWALLTDLVAPRDPPLTGTAVAAIEDFDLADDLAALPSELSYGRRRAVAIARAVAGRPSILLLDEPAAGLDETESRELGHLIRRLASEWGIGVLLIEHDVELVFDVCDRVTALDFGHVIASGSSDEVRNDPAVRDAYLGTEPGSRGRQTRPDERADPHIATGADEHPEVLA